jgi:hypothetical protein
MAPEHRTNPCTHPLECLFVGPSVRVRTTSSSITPDVIDLSVFRKRCCYFASVRKGNPAVEPEENSIRTFLRVRHF